ncbi:NADH:flavin oxidoreductase/NADH oxidase [Microbispora amethystogenes]|uniref:NADH:flavin oxidoreductase/NADH oxidase n=1 Tax=Microbispora amethystogenes TaxID=1427754 RepID=UPI0033FCD039
MDRTAGRKWRILPGKSRGASLFLFEPFKLRSVVFRNRLGLAPMSQYSAEDHRPVDWHFAHYLTRSMGLGLTLVEATAVSREGAVTPQDLGVWDDTFVAPLRRLVEVIESQGAVPGLQLSHAGRKASRTRPWDGDVSLPVQSGGWPIVGPSPTRFAEGYLTPEPLDEPAIDAVVDDFSQAARRAREAGFRFLELHAGHGRLLHSFLSPLANERTDRWGGSFENRCRLLLDVVRGVRGHWPDELPLSVRLSCVDWAEGGWSLEDSVRASELLRSAGVDLIDCTSGGIMRPLRVEAKPGYQVEFAKEIRKGAGIATAAVGLIQDVRQARQVVEAGDADMVLMGRSLLADPLQVIRLADRGETGVIPRQYRRAFTSTARAPRPSSDFIPEL